MRFLIVIYSICLLVTNAAVILNKSNEPEAQVIKYENTNNGAGNYKFSFETTNGITREETGYLVNIGKDDEHIVVEGSYSYTDVDGKTIIINYTADENGYHIINSPKELSLNEGVSPNVIATLLGK